MMSQLESYHYCGNPQITGCDISFHMRDNT